MERGGTGESGGFTARSIIAPLPTGRSRPTGAIGRRPGLSSLATTLATSNEREPGVGRGDRGKCRRRHLGVAQSLQ